MRHSSLLRSLLILGVAAALPACGGGGGGGGGPALIPMTLVSASALSVVGNGDSDSPVMSADGRYVAFRSSASNLVAGDTVQSDIFRKDLQDNSIIRVSRAAGNTQPNAGCSSPSMSSDGRWIAYISNATDIVVSAGIGGTRSNVYLFDATNLTTTLVSHSTVALTTEATGNSFNPSVVSVGGAPTVYVAYESDAQDIIAGLSYSAGSHIYRKTAGGAQALVSRDVTTATTTGNSSSVLPSISADGNLIAFQSAASNLIAAGTDTNGLTDIFVRNMTASTTQLVSLTDADFQITGAGSFTPQISADGLHVVFMSQGTNLGDPDTSNDIYVRTIAAGTTTQMSEHPMVDGFGSTGSNCNTPAISSDGNLIVWPSGAEGLVNSDTNLMRDIFRRNRTGNVLDRVSLTPDGLQATGGTGLTASISRPSISTGGTFIAFDTNATNLLSPVTTGRQIIRRG